MKSNLKYIVWAVVISLCFGSCKQTTSEIGRTPVLEVNGKFLYQDELKNIVPAGSSSEDSTQLVTMFIRKWVTEALLYESARKNVPNEAEINKMVEEYRKSLTIHNYLQVLVEQRLAKPTDNEISAFYEKHKQEFPLSENIVKGVFLKVPGTAPKLDKVKKWLKAGDAKSLELLDKYTLQHAANYDYFGDRWLYFSDFQKQWPSKIEYPKSFLESNTFYETADSSYIYMIKFYDYCLAESVAPLEFAQDRIRDILFNRKKIEYIRRIEEEIFNDALKNEVVTYF